LLLTLGLAGGGLTTTQVLLAGITGGFGGAISMALGEYIATKSQGQVTQAELKLEKEHLMNHREQELNEVRTFMQELNLEGELLEKCVAAINQRDEAMIRLMMAFEFGFQEELERNPLKAMATSGLLFLSGSLPSVLPYAVTTNANTAIFISIALACAALFGIGAGKTKVTKGPWLYDGMENLILGAIGGAATFGLGKAYGTGRTTAA
jgi:VIT1/CCC1 family predicted Fe2+/Mn2+ transporter